MSGFGSSLGTTQEYIPVVPSTQIGRYAGLAMHFSTLTDGAGDAAGSTSLLAAVLAERRNITLNGTGIWNSGQSFTVATEPLGVKRVWTVGGSASASNANTVVLRAGLTVTLAADTNTVLATSGAPSSGTGANGDLAIDYAGNTYYVKAAGAWGSASAVYASDSSGSSAPSRIAASTTFDLTTPNAQKAMPATATTIPVVSTMTLIPSSTLGDNALTWGDYQLHVPLTLPVGTGSGQWSKVSGTSDNIAGNFVRVSGWVAAGRAVAVISATGTFNNVAPALGTPVIASDGLSFTLPATDTDSMTFSGVASNFHLAGTIAKAKTIGTPTYTSGTITVPVTPAFGSADVPTLSVDAGVLTDTDGNTSAAVSAVSMTNNAPAAVLAPNAPVISAGAIASSSCTVTVTASVVDSGHSAAATYQTFYRATGTSGSWLSDTASSSLSRPIGGLTNGTSVDFYVVATNTGGPSGHSNTIAMTPAAAQSASLTATAMTADSTAMDQVYTLDWAIYTNNNPLGTVLASKNAGIIGTITAANVGSSQPYGNGIPDLTGGGQDDGSAWRVNYAADGTKPITGTFTAQGTGQSQTLDIFAFGDNNANGTHGVYLTASGPGVTTQTAQITAGGFATAVGKFRVVYTLPVGQALTLLVSGDQSPAAVGGVGMGIGGIGVF